MQTHLDKIAEENTYKASMKFRVIFRETWKKFGKPKNLSKYPNDIENTLLSFFFGEPTLDRWKERFQDFQDKDGKQRKNMEFQCERWTKIFRKLFRSHKLLS